MAGLEGMLRPYGCSAGSMAVALWFGSEQSDVNQVEKGVLSTADRLAKMEFAGVEYALLPASRGVPPSRDKSKNKDPKVC